MSFTHLMKALKYKLIENESHSFGDNEDYWDKVPR